MIHNTAIIGDSVTIGKNVTIGPYCVIGNGAIIEDDVMLKSHVVTEGKVTIGQGTKIYPFASISYPQTLKYQGEDSAVVIGKNNTIREYVTIQHGTSEDKMVTLIGDNCLFMVGVHVAHNCVVGNNVICANYVNLAGHVTVGDFVVIGGLSAVQQFCRIGEHSMIGGASAIDKDLVPYALASGNRAYLEGLNLVGLNRRGFDKGQSLQASKVLKEIFLPQKQEAMVFMDRVARAKEAYAANNLVQNIIAFILADNARSFCAYKQ
jgi:UDP-N-acetylglucosamine acyltransferase